VFTAREFARNFYNIRLYKGARARIPHVTKKQYIHYIDNDVRNCISFLLLIDKNCSSRERYPRFAQIVTELIFFHPFIDEVERARLSRIFFTLPVALPCMDVSYYVLTNQSALQTKSNKTSSSFLLTLPTAN